VRYQYQKMGCVFLSVMLFWGCSEKPASDRSVFQQTTLAAMITNNSITSNISGEANSTQIYSINVPAGATYLTIITTGGTGDPDLYVAFNRVPRRLDFDFNSWLKGSEESIRVASPLVGIYQVMIHGYTEFSGLTLDMSFTSPEVDSAVVIPPDPDGFLSFLNKSSPRNNELTGPDVPWEQDAGLAYYRAIDPQNRRLTLDDFKAFNNLSDAETAVYVNDADLGFGRRMYLSAQADGTVASCVENFAPLLDGAPNVGAQASEKLALAKTGNPADIIATVCMEFSGTPDTGDSAATLQGRKYVKFFSYIADGSRITAADLDGRGAKTQPGLCNTCHGGQGNSLVNGVYPLNGDTSAQFLPWDLDTFVYDTEPGFTRADLEPIFKRFNQGVLATYPQPKTFSFQGNVVIPDNIDPIGSTSVTSSLTVENMTDPIISLVLSIDDDGVGGPGLVFSELAYLDFELITPNNNVIRLRPGLGPSRVPVIRTGMKNLYLADDAGKVNDKEVDGVVSGTIKGVYPLEANGFRTRFVSNNTCINGIVAESATDLGCSTANGVWQLRVSNKQPVALAARFTGAIKAWSLHFNGIPDNAYTPAPVELIRGWYGGKDLPRATVDSSFVPAGWTSMNNPSAVANPETLYLEVIGPTCRACHAQRGTMAFNEIDFSSYQKFMIYDARTQSLVFDKGLMPIAKRTYEEHFWNGAKPAILAQHMPGLDPREPLLKPGRNIADAGIFRTGALAVRTGDTVTLNGRASLFPNAFAWRVTSPSQGVTTLTGVAPTFVASEVGNYEVYLDTHGDAEPTPTSTSRIVIESSETAMGPISFRESVSNYTSVDRTSAFSSCDSSRCHGSVTGGQAKEGAGALIFTRENATAEELDETYRLVRDRSDVFLPFDSLIISKGLDITPHGGGDFSAPFDSKWSTFPSYGKDRYDLFVRWLLEGANNN